MAPVGRSCAELNKSISVQDSIKSTIIHETQGFSTADSHRRFGSAHHKNHIGFHDQSRYSTGRAQWQEVICSRGDDGGGAAAWDGLGPLHRGGVGAAISEADRRGGPKGTAFEGRDRIESRRLGNRRGARPRAPIEKPARATPRYSDSHQGQ